MSKTNLNRKSEKDGSHDKQWSIFAVGILSLAAVLLICINSYMRKATLEPDSPTAVFVEHLNRRVPELLERSGVPGASIALVRGGEVVWTGAYGFADVETGRPMEVETVFRAESISKSVTALGIMRLVDRDQIDLDAPITNYLNHWQTPESAYPFEQVTVRSLLSNSAGIPLGKIGAEAEYAIGSEMPSLMKYLSEEVRLIREPGKSFEYSNPGFNLLELLIEDTTNQNFAEYMQNEVLTPLGMDSASYAWREKYRHSIATGYDLDGNPVPAYLYPASASGGLFADVEDIARFVRAEINALARSEKAVFASSSITAVVTPQIEISGLFSQVADYYGFGHFIETLPDGGTAFWHGGQGHGWMTHFHAIPEKGAAIIILTNSQRSWPLIAQLLTDWTTWAGLDSVKFSRISIATTAVWLLSICLGSYSGWSLTRLALGLRSGKRYLGPLSSDRLLRRSIKLITGFGITALIVWRSSQPYVFESSIFPAATPWFYVSLVAFSVSLILHAMLPETNSGLPRKIAR